MQNHIMRIWFPSSLYAGVDSRVKIVLGQRSEIIMQLIRTDLAMSVWFEI
jgi:metal-responsive CopG/Arc/MetJ family transcriptional regulator